MVMMMAPGGTKEMAKAVLDEGAEATYVGVRGWSRRGAKHELDDNDIHEVIDYALSKDKEVRIVMNTLPSSTEIPMFLERVRMYTSWGAKGFMISDVGCMRLVRQHVPAAAIHTSVGCGITNYEDVKFLSAIGASYVVLPYRMSVAEIAQMKSEGNVGIEVFLFKTPSGGKICPGKCMMSSFFSFRRWLDETGKDYFFGSASRGGDCLRVCQSEWDFSVDGVISREHMTTKTNPALWLTELPDYLKAGVDCLKVPGRDRSTNLVREIVRLYRRVVDLILENDRPDLAPFAPQLEALRRRWTVERGVRDDLLISEAETESRRVMLASA
ncbi:MAG: peptidase U32 family protein [Pseudomonadota bacterium]